MIVNPQFFNYKLVISSLLITIVILSSISVVGMQSLKSHQKFLTKEKKLVESELSQTLANLSKAQIELDSIKSRNTKNTNSVKVYATSLRN